MLTITGPGSITEPAGGLCIAGPGWRVEVHARVSVPGRGEAVLLADGHWMTLAAWRRWMARARRGDPARTATTPTPIPTQGPESAPATEPTTTATEGA